MNLLDCILKWAKEGNLDVKKEEDGIIFHVNGKSGSWYARVGGIEDEKILFVVTAYPFQVTESERLKAAISLMEITSQLKMGAFYIDMEDGQINFRLSQIIFDLENEADRIQDLIMLAMSVTDTYYKKIMKLALRM